jgi:hypothetical protein
MHTTFLKGAIIASMVFLVSCANQDATPEKVEPLRTPFAIIVRSAESDAPIAGLQAIVVDDSTRQADTVVTNANGEAISQVVRGHSVRALLMGVMLRNDTTTAFAVPADGPMASITVKMSAKDVAEAKDRMQRQQAYERMYRMANGSMVFKTIAASARSSATASPVVDEPVLFTNPATGASATLRSDAEGFLFLRGSTIGVTDGNGFTMQSAREPRDGKLFVNAQGTTTFTYAAQRLPAAWNGTLNFITIPIAGK